MATSDLDPNLWYRMYTANAPADYLSCNSMLDSSAQQTTDENQEIEWQILQFNSTAWTIRCHLGGPDIYLGTVPDDSGSKLLTMVHNETVDASVYWEVLSQGDESWALRNVPRPADPSVDKRPIPTPTTIASDFAAPASIRWSFESVSAIKDPAFSDASLPYSPTTACITPAVASTDISTTTATTLHTTSRPSSISYLALDDTVDPPESHPIDSSGLSTSAEAAIIAVVGGVILIGLILLCLCLRRRRKRKQARKISQRELQNQISELLESNNEKSKTEGIQELLQSNVASEAPIGEGLAELPNVGRQIIKALNSVCEAV